MATTGHSLRDRQIGEQSIDLSNLIPLSDLAPLQPRLCLCLYLCLCPVVYTLRRHFVVVASAHSDCSQRP